MRRTERVTVSLPVEQVARLRRAASQREMASVSAYVSAAVSEALDRDAALERLAHLYADRNVTLEPEHHAWARQALGLAANESQAHAS
jgi:Arc/MetJ-type ribon-helix-helix transcriptional regulator